MKKLIYQSPQVEVIELQTEGVIAQSLFTTEPNSPEDFELVGNAW